MAIAILACNMAKFWPIQIRGPQPKGRYDAFPFVTFPTPSENRPGLNFLASSPHN